MLNAGSIETVDSNDNCWFRLLFADYPTAYNIAHFSFRDTKL